jgi:hypothetical protein
MSTESETAEPLSTAALRSQAGVFEGPDGFLFLVNDSNGLFDQHLGLMTKPRRWMDHVAQLHVDRQVALAALGTDYFHVIVPNKETALTALLPADMQYGLKGSPPAVRYLKNNPEVADFTSFDPAALRNYPPEAVYRRDDTHWTPLGAFLHMAGVLAKRPAYQSVIQYFLGPMIAVANRRPGDLGSKVPGTPINPYPILTPTAPAGELVHTNGLYNRARVRIYRNPSAPDRRKLFVAHDSFGDSLQLLLPTIFETVAFVHTPDFDHELIAELQPDLYLNQQVERFFIRAPTNSLRTEEYISAVAADRGVEPSASPAETLASLRQAFI